MEERFGVSKISYSKELTTGFERLVLLEINKFKFLLNPIKLAIMKLLCAYSAVPAFVIRDLLRISWGKFTANINALQEKGYLSIECEFYEGSPTRIMKIENLGRIRYRELGFILSKIIEID